MKLFMTGGTGFVGGHLIQELHARGHDVTAICRAATPTRIPLTKQPHWTSREFFTVTAQDMFGHDVFVHLAAAGMPNNPEKVSFSDMYRYNVAGLVHLLECAKEAGVQKIVIGSTFKEYGDSCAEYAFIPTTASLQPTTPFACSRVSGFYAAQAFASHYGVDIEYVRFFNMYGDGENALDLWTALKTAATLGRDFDMTNGEQVRDYIAVEQAVQQLSSICERPTKRGLTTHHIASGVPIRLRDFTDKWWTEWGATGKINYGALPYRAYESMRIVAKV